MRAEKQTSKQPSVSDRSHRLFPHTVPPAGWNPFTVKQQQQQIPQCFTGDGFPNS